MVNRYDYIWVGDDDSDLLRVMESTLSFFINAGKKIISVIYNGDRLTIYYIGG